MTNTDELTALKHLAAGRSIPFTATAAGLDTATVDAYATAAGYPNTVRVKARIAELLAAGDTPIPVRAPEAAPRLRPVPAPPATRAATPGPSALTVDELVRACRRSEFKRTQSLGVKLTELAEKITAALRAERETAEDKARRAAEREAAQAEVKRLEKALTAARANAVAAGAPGGVRGGERICSVCDAHLANGQALGAHKRHKHGIAGTAKTTETRTA